MLEAKHLQHMITSGFIQIVVEDRLIPAYWAHPKSGGPFPGLILLHDDRGLSAHARALVHRFAEVGYYVAAPDLFDGQRPTTQGEASALEIEYTPSGEIKVAATLAALRTHHNCNSKMALLGWDFGGSLAFHAAIHQEDLMAVVSFYGNPARHFGSFKAAHCPILAIFGSEDEITTRHENQLREDLIRSGEPHEVIVYPGAKHGFYNDTLLTYNEQAASDAWNQALAFLETHQGKPPVPHGVDGFTPGTVY